MTGYFVLSLDTELAWGTGSARALRRSARAFDGYRPLVRRLVDLLDRHDVPATWAIVGHLLHLSCGDDAGGACSCGPREEIRKLRAGRGLNDGWYFAPDVIDMIRGAAVDHEIGSHSFTHCFPADPAVTRDLWAAEMRSVARTHSAHGLPLDSFVFPRNQVAHTDLLVEQGMSAYRGPEQSWYAGTGGLLHRTCHFLDRTLAFRPPTYSLDELPVQAGLVDVPASQFLMTYRGVRAAIPTASRVIQARRGLRAAAARGEVFHLWFHPYNLGLDGRGRMFGALEQILEEVAALRSSGRIETVTMATLADRALSRSA